MGNQKIQEERGKKRVEKSEINRKKSQKIRRIEEKEKHIKIKIKIKA